MAERADLEAAAAAGIIAADRVDPLYAFLRARATEAAAPRPSGEEDLRFIRNFHDVFLAIGIGLLSIGMIVAVLTIASRRGGDFSAIAALIGLFWLGAALVIWVLAEFFARRRRLFLPAIALCLSFVFFVPASAFCLYGAGVGVSDWSNGPAAAGLDRLVWQARLMPAVVALSALGAAGLFYWRFRLPFSMGAIGSAGALAFGAVLFAAAPQQVWEARVVVMFAAGVALFLAGVWFDARDPARGMRFSDNAFWLHVAAAPLILNGALALADVAELGRYRQVAADAFNPETVDPQAGGAVLRSLLTLAIVGVLGVISLLINRRALIVSALVTTGVAIWMLMDATGLGQGALAAGTLVTLGGFVLVIGASWHAMRRALLGWVRPGGALARIFPPEQTA